MSVYDISGKLIDILKRENQHIGEYTIDWDGSNSNGWQLKTGVYYLVTEAQTEGQIVRQTREMVISR